MKIPLSIIVLSLLPWVASAELERVEYNHPGLIVDLGVGLWAWPMPMDWDQDGDLDLVVSCPGTPFNGTYFFENDHPDQTMPVFKPPVRVGEGLRNMRVSYVNGRPRVLTPGREWLDFLGKGFKSSRAFYHDGFRRTLGKVRASQWQHVDFEGDGALDLIVGIGDWDDYGWDNAFDSEGNWTRGPLHGYVYWIPNRGSTARPDYGKPRKLRAGGQPVDVYGMPSPNLADFDGDGDLDLLCGEFLDGFTYFQNVGSRADPRYAEGQRLTHGGQPLAMHLEMITPSAVDWDGDGDIDLIVGDEDGRVALLEHTGRAPDGVPAFLPPKYFQQEARDLKFGALATPVSVDWDGDGDEDLICGNTSGNIGFIENLDGGNPPRWARPRLLQAGGKTLRLQAGEHGSIQGPCEAKWGYTTLSVADWDGDGPLDLIVNSIWGRVVWYRNTGTRARPRLATAKPITVDWGGPPPKPAWNWWDPGRHELATQWRTTPAVIDWDQDGLLDLIMLDHEGYLALFRRQRRGEDLILLPGERVFRGGQYDSQGRRQAASSDRLRLNTQSAGASGRRKFCIVDWDGDGRRDLLVNSSNVNFLRNVSKEGPPWTFQDMGALAATKLAGHTTSPTTVDWDGDGVRDLLVGAEDGCFYYRKNESPPPAPRH